MEIIIPFSPTRGASFEKKSEYPLSLMGLTAHVEIFFGLSWSITMGEISGQTDRLTHRKCLKLL